MHRLFILLLPLLLLPARSQAIVNMEELHTGEPQEGFSGRVELSLESRHGNSEKEEYTLGSRLQHHRDAVTRYLLLSGSYGESNGVKYAEKAFLHARHMHELGPVMTAEGYLQAEYDKFARLELRTLFGGGLRLTLLPRAKRGEAYLGLGAYYSEERIDETYIDGGTEVLWRANSYLVLKYQASDNTTLVSTTYYQPAFKGAEDYRLLEQAAMKVKMSDRLSLVVALDYRRDNRPPLGVKEEDLHFTTSLSLEF